MRLMTIVLSVFLSGAVHAKDLSHRLGVGYADQFGLDESVPSLALRYYPNSDFGLMGTLGLNTAQKDAKFGLGLKVLRTVFREDHLNFYVAGGAALVSDEVDGHTASGFSLGGVVGTEFFIPGLDNLGINFEAGVGVTSLSSEVRVRTIGDHPLRAGMFFYF